MTTTLSSSTNSARARLGALLAAFLLLAFLTATTALASGLAVTTGGATEIMKTSAHVSGTVNTDGLETATGFVYGTTAEYGEVEPAGVISPGKEKPVEISADLTGLEPATTYHYAAVAFHGETLVFGKDRTFTTEHAPRFEAGSYASDLAGLQSGEIFDFGGLLTVECESGELSGEATEAGSDLSLDASYDECESTAGAATIEMNSCSYGLHVSNSGPPYVGTMAIECAEEADAIEIKGFLCTVEVPAQQLTGSVSYANKGEGDNATVSAGAELSEIAYTSSGYGCEVLALPSEGVDGSSELDTTLAALDSEEAATGFVVAGVEQTIGLSVAGEESGEEAVQPRFEFDDLPAVLDGTQSGEIFDFGGLLTVECESRELSGGATEAGSDLSLDASYDECISDAGGTTIEMNSCSYGLHVSNSGPSYVGTMAIECAEEADAIEIKGFLCTVEVPAQQLTGSVSYANKGEGDNATVSAGAELSEIAYTSSGYGCEVLAIPAEAEDGSISSTLTIGARYPG